MSYILSHMYNVYKMVYVHCDRKYAGFFLERLMNSNGAHYVNTYTREAAMKTHTKKNNTRTI